MNFFDAMAEIGKGNKVFRKLHSQYVFSKDNFPSTIDGMDFRATDWEIFKDETDHAYDLYEQDKEDANRVHLRSTVYSLHGANQWCDDEDDEHRYYVKRAK